MPKLLQFNGVDWEEIICQHSAESSQILALAGEVVSEHEETANHDP